ncbi:hypothetical protein S7711_10741 [Stachybotrys chartarum IBT 7711]|uniref:Uncharacterized protein n=1 Tax=Stachybotrys chartarum (strain CBS 109288 / IBT 7711) TaxID=1280523 RepID=A0A084AH03_STACB|nr:hypothetical protein S7711_10741 [Stachybotrys chartarum IBT 7711]KFA55941.1 hypothetical protein S40293_11315 [Stachybotrys chartarum IBT 40293]
MQITKTLAVLSHLTLVLALPAPTVDTGFVALDRNSREGSGRGGAAGDGDTGVAPSAIFETPAATPSATPAAPGAEEPAEGGEEVAENEVEQEGQFDVPIVLPAGDKVDTLFPPGTNGIFEIEIQTGAEKTLTVTQNPNPGPAPAGFVHLEPNSFIVSLAEGPAGATLQKVDYIANAGSTIDLSQGVIGRFCAEAGAFVTDAAIGEQEFELEENELLIEVADMNGEWAFFVPDPAAAGGAENAEDVAPDAGGDDAAGGAADTAAQLAQLLLDLINGGANNAA